MDNKKLFQELERLQEKTDQLSKRFAESKQKAMKDAEELEAVIQEMEVQERELYSLYILDDIEVSVYEEQKAETDKKRKQLATLQKKIADVDAVKKQELTKIYQEFHNQYEKEFMQVVRKERTESEKRLLEAKQEYMDKVEAEAKHMMEFTETERFFTDIKVEIGLEDYNRSRFFGASNPYKRFNLESIEGYESINIGMEELYQAYQQIKGNLKG